MPRVLILPHVRSNAGTRHSVAEPRHPTVEQLLPGEWIQTGNAFVRDLGAAPAVGGVWLRRRVRAARLPDGRASLVVLCQKCWWEAGIVRSAAETWLEPGYSDGAAERLLSHLHAGRVPAG